MTVGIDMGRQMQAKRRKRRKPLNVYLRAMGDTHKPSERLRYLQTRAAEMRAADEIWASLPVWKRIGLSLMGETALSYYGRRG
jgi:hypothetical protein